MIGVTHKNFWSKHGLPFVTKTVGNSGIEVFKSMWVSTLPRGEGIFTLTERPNYSTKTQMLNVCQRIHDDVVKIGNTTFCPIDDVDDTKDHRILHGLIKKTLFLGRGITDILVKTDEDGNYKGITIMKEDEDAEGIKFWYISFLCVATGTKGYGSEMIKSIQQEANRNPNIQYVFLESTDDSRGFYKKMNFLDVFPLSGDDKSKPVCLRGDILDPTIRDPPNYQYNDNDLMVYCPNEQTRVPKKLNEKKETEENTEKNNGGSKTRRIKKKKKGTRRV